MDARNSSAGLGAQRSVAYETINRSAAEGHYRDRALGFATQLHGSSGLATGAEVVKSAEAFTEFLGARTLSKISDETIARIAHEVNREWCAFNGDHTQVGWEDAPDWQRNSAINGVAFHRANPNAGDSASHDNWMKEKLEAGWSYGPEKNTAQLKHPCLVPFDQLPGEQQFKDRLFRTIVHAALTS